MQISSCTSRLSLCSIKPDLLTHFLYLPEDMLEVIPQRATFQIFDFPATIKRLDMSDSYPVFRRLHLLLNLFFSLSFLLQRLNVEGLDDLVLQRLWFQVNQGVLKKIIRVMPERHPSRPYTAEFERRFRDAEGIFVESHPAEVFQQELPDTIQDIWDGLTEEPDRVPDSSWRFASPKSLLDNFCHTMFCLFSECFASTEAPQDYCDISHWRKGRKKDLKPES
uniref:Interleukin 34 n=1 Tax=Acanthochromis polyacanthus TaxID=80966 RepID=A0A3Q1HGW9_9TELE